MPRRALPSQPRPPGRHASPVRASASVGICSPRALPPPGPRRRNVPRPRRRPGAQPARPSRAGIESHRSAPPRTARRDPARTPARRVRNETLRKLGACFDCPARRAVRAAFRPPEPPPARSGHGPASPPFAPRTDPGPFDLRPAWAKPAALVARCVRAPATTARGPAGCASARRSRTAAPVSVAGAFDPLPTPCRWPPRGMSDKCKFQAGPMGLCAGTAGRTRAVPHVG